MIRAMLAMLRRLFSQQVNLEPPGKCETVYGFCHFFDFFLTFELEVRCRNKLRLFCVMWVYVVCNLTEYFSLMARTSNLYVACLVNLLLGENIS